MEITEKEITALFLEVVKNDLQLKEFYNIARKRSRGKVFLIGSRVYGELAKIIYGKYSPEERDFDFLAEAPSRDKMIIPKGWELKFTDYGNPYFTRNNERIDLNFLINFNDLLLNNLKPTINNFLKISPLNIQAIAFDYSSKRIIGKRGIEAIKSGVLRVCNENTAENYARRKHKTIESILKEKAEELGFKYVLPQKQHPKMKKDMKHKLAYH